jgi:chromosome segregation protein
MKLSRLRLAGFKTFAEASDMVIEDGLTGIVGPNGCGKSNLVEALRWVMGENAYKTMRASGMDDVIFSGSQGRPGRSVAEVTLTLDHIAEETAKLYGSEESLKISRRIDRGLGSTYRINGREVRAKDVQLLFADASTGSRSTAMVRQGQIAELITAKPSARRSILEEAAGISGLYQRRHEAETRLKATQANLSRIEDMLKELSSRTESLKRQAKQAEKFEKLSQGIQKLEAMLFLIRWNETDQSAKQAIIDLEDAEKACQQAASEQQEAVRKQAIAQHACQQARSYSEKTTQEKLSAEQALRDAETQRRRDEDRREALVTRLQDLDIAIEREKSRLADAEAQKEKLYNRQNEITGTPRQETEHLLQSLQKQLEDLQAEEAKCDKVFSEMSAELQNQRNALKSHTQALEQAKQELNESAKALAKTDKALDEFENSHLSAEVAEAEERRKALENDIGEIEKALIEARQAVGQAKAYEQGAKETLNTLRSKANTLVSEQRALKALLGEESNTDLQTFSSIITIQSGYEEAVAVSLGEMLEAVPEDAAEPDAKLILKPQKETTCGALPVRTIPLSNVVMIDAFWLERSRELQSCLTHIGLVDRVLGDELQAYLKPGQMLVSKEGDLWRWDGLIKKAGLLCETARKLEARNRMQLLERAVEELSRRTERQERSVSFAEQETAQAKDTLKCLEKTQKEKRTDLDKAIKAESKAREANAWALARQSNLQENRAREHEIWKKARTALLGLEAMQPKRETAKLEKDYAEGQDKLLKAREATTLARNALIRLELEQERQENTRQSLKADLEHAEKQVANLQADLQTLHEKKDEKTNLLKDLSQVPETEILKLQELQRLHEQAHANHEKAIRLLKRTEQEVQDYDRKAIKALETLSQLREKRAAVREKELAVETRRDDLRKQIQDSLAAEPSQLAGKAGISPDANVPVYRDIDIRLIRLKDERDRLGSINHQASEELSEFETRLSDLTKQSEDLKNAITRLNKAIEELNEEGRIKLLDAFHEVNQHFQSLFERLFDGGTAKLHLIDSSDPLDAGLDIIARPPGKKPQTITLLSGGEQTLTALSLIFAVFLSNPAPVCVLDEVDAPLDDANVKRFCDLMRDIERRSKTRLLVVTHNPITMASMDRLYGVTMQEKGISRLVSVDLQTGIAFQEAV